MWVSVSGFGFRGSASTAAPVRFSRARVQIFAADLSGLEFSLIVFMIMVIIMIVRMVIILIVILIVAIMIMDFFIFHGSGLCVILVVE